MLVGTNSTIDKSLPENILSIHRTQNPKELAEIYTTSNIFFNPTREEVLGLVNLEALACGTPVVTFNSGGSPECIDESCGIIVQKDDIEASVDAILKIKASPFTKEVCIKQASKFSQANKFEDYVNLYKKLSERF